MDPPSAAVSKGHCRLVPHAHEPGSRIFSCRHTGRVPGTATAMPTGLVVCSPGAWHHGERRPRECQPSTKNAEGAVVDAVCATRTEVRI